MRWDGMANAGHMRTLSHPAAIPLCALGSPAHDVGEQVLHPTAAIGYTLIEQSSAGVKQVLINAERALRAAKHSDF